MFYSRAYAAFSAIALLFVISANAYAQESASQAAGKNQIAVQVNAKEIVVSGVSPGTDVYLFGGLQVGREFYTTLMAVDLIATDEDRDGVVTFAYTKGVPLRSVWVAVDQRNGDLGVGVPAGYTLRMRTIPPGAWKRKSGTSIDALAIEHRALEYLLVHPGQGVWRWQADQGSKRDEDGLNDNVVTVSPASMRRADKKNDNASATFGSGYLMVAIDPFSLEVLTSRVPQ
ncbi:MAG: hypothetical protein ACTHQM_24810 [Thermoanaerobaculia bacterium]